MRRQDWNAACGRWEQLRREFPDHAAGFVRGAEALRGAERWEEAEALAGQAVERFPDHRGAHAQWSKVATRRQNRETSSGQRAKIGQTLFEGALGLVRRGWRRTPRIEGAVENRPRPEVRGWVLDPDAPGRSRRVSIRIEGGLREVVDADRQRGDIARWKGSGGRHGFLWCPPEDWAAKEGTRIDVLDADTGQPLNGSPIRIEDGRAIASKGRRS